MSSARSQSDAMCSILTEPMFKDRVLGVSRTASAPTCTTWFITGNNLTIHGDLTTRMLACRIDPECERPEEREFKVNLHEEVPKRRAELAVAALTIIRAYIAAGSPRQRVPTFGRFEQWQEWCRFPLIWLGHGGPVRDARGPEERDPVRERLAELSAAWGEVYGQGEATLATAIKDATARSAFAARCSERRPRSAEGRHHGGGRRGRRTECPQAGLVPG